MSELHAGQQTNARIGQAMEEPDQVPGAHLPRWIPPAGFIMGVVALAYLLYVAQTTPKVSSFAWQIYKPVLALGGAAFSVALSGFLRVFIRAYDRAKLVAGQSLAVFLILFFWLSPPLPE